MMLRKLYISSAFILVTVMSLAAQDNEALAKRIDLQRYQFPQEKIHVMTDRGSYLAGGLPRTASPSLSMANP